jgi:hypothetical protein
MFGRWMVDSSELHFENSTTAYLRAMGHESPQIKFTRGVPLRGDTVRCNIALDVCMDRGREKHRPIAKFVLRVVPQPIKFDGELRFRMSLVANQYENEKYRPLWPVRLDKTGRWWLLKVTPANEALLSEASESGELPDVTPDWHLEPPPLSKSSEPDEVVL